MPTCLECETNGTNANAALCNECEMRTPMPDAKLPTTLIADRNGEKHDPLEVAEFLDDLGERSNGAIDDALFSAADVVRWMYSKLQNIPEPVRCRECGGIYVASKAKHGAMWRKYRAEGMPITSTWIDESEHGQTADWADLWQRAIHEASTCAAMIIYSEDGETQKGQLVELGAALAHDRPVYAVGFTDRSKNHPNVLCVESLSVAFLMAQQHVDNDAEPKTGVSREKIPVSIGSLSWKKKSREWVLLSRSDDPKLLECIIVVDIGRRALKAFCYLCGWKSESSTAKLDSIKELCLDHAHDVHELCSRAEPKTGGAR